MFGSSCPKLSPPIFVFAIISEFISVGKKYFLSQCFLVLFSEAEKRAVGVGKKYLLFSEAEKRAVGVGKKYLLFSEAEKRAVGVGKKYFLCDFNETEKQQIDLLRFVIPSVGFIAINAMVSRIFTKNQ